jgi:hypothetical protein
MARKPMTKTNNKVNEEVKEVNEIKNIEAEEVKEVVKPKKRVKVNHDVEVKVVNNTTGKLIYRDSRSQQVYEMAEYKDITYITVGELLNMKNTQKDMLEKYWIILEEVIDDELELEYVLAYLNIKDNYEKVAEYVDVEKTLNEISVSEIMELFKKLPKSFVVSMVEISALLYKQGKFNDHQKIQFIKNYTKLENLYN